MDMTQIMQLLQALIWVLVGLSIAVYAFSCLCLMKIAQKTGTDPAWWAWIPLLQTVLMVKIAGKPWWWVLLWLFVPIVNIYVTFVVLAGIARARGRSAAFSLVLLFLPIIGYPILAFSGGGGGVGVVGLDIGASAVKAVELKRTRDGCELVSMGLEALAPETVVDGVIIDTAAVSTAIETIFSQQKIKNKNVATSVSGHSVIIKKVNMPVLPDDELYDQVHADAAQYIPFDMADVSLDYQKLEEIPVGEQQEILLVAVKKEKISNYTSALSMTGRAAVVVDVDAFALQNAYEFNYQPELDKTVALLNIGATVMNINIVRNGISMFTRDVSVGGNQYTDALQKELQLTFEDAENLKRGEQVATVAEEQKTAVLRSVSEILVLEIQKTLDFFRATASGESIQQIFVAGGSARVPGLLDLLREEFQVEVQELNPFGRIAYNPAKFSAEYISEVAPRLAVAVGLGLRSFDQA